jgi:hypothetical protein
LPVSRCKSCLRLCNRQIPVLVLVDALGFLNANDQNEVRLPVVKFLASQRASSIQPQACGNRLAGALPD